LALGFDLTPLYRSLELLEALLAMRGVFDAVVVAR
jgi:hypothetical protein